MTGKGEKTSRRERDKNKHSYKDIYRRNKRTRTEKHCHGTEAQDPIANEKTVFIRQLQNTVEVQITRQCRYRQSGSAGAGAVNLAVQSLQLVIVGLFA